MRALLAAAVVLLAAAGCVRQDDGVRPGDYITDKDYTRWVVEVDHAEGRVPPAAVLSAVEARLAEVVRKPGGIEFVTQRQLPTGGTWSARALQDLADEKRDTPTRGDTVVTHVLVLGGTFSPNDDVLGVTIGYDLIAIFQDRILQAAQAGCPLPVGCATNQNDVQVAVWTHEFGHALGLVNRGTPMVEDHEADTCGEGSSRRPDENHSTNPRSVMTCEVESSALLSLLGGGIPTTFDSDDKADLRAAGGK